jgi:hypothetical protein
MNERVSLLIATLFVVGCGTTSEPGSSTTQSRAQDPSADRRDAPVPGPSEKPVEPAAPPSKPEPYVPDPEGFGDACSDDAGCGWDDPCVATRCIGATQVPDDLKCDESAPPPGTCSCVEGRCSLRPKDTPAAAPSCRTETCGLEQSAGRCVAGSQLQANRYTRDLGPACHCDQDSLECRFVWVEAIACEDVGACWVSESPPYHPIPRPKSMRGRKFKPCSDGEVAPICRDGLCSVVAYSC